MTVTPIEFVAAVRDLGPNMWWEAGVLWDCTEAAAVARMLCVLGLRDAANTVRDGHVEDCSCGDVFVLDAIETALHL